MRTFLTLTGYQFTWLACAFGENKFSLPSLGIFIGVIYLILYWYFSYNKIKFFKVALCIAVPGYLFDTLMVYFNIYLFNSSLIFGTLPLWMIILWLSFSTLFDELLIFFKNYKIIGLLLSTLLGPFTYFISESIGVISINNLILFFVLMIIFWFFLMMYYLEIILKKI